MDHRLIEAAGRHRAAMADDNLMRDRQQASKGVYYEQSKTHRKRYHRPIC